MKTEVSEADETTILFTTETPKLREVLDEILREQAEGTAPAALAGLLSGYSTQRGQLAVLLGILRAEEFPPSSPVLHPGVQRAMRYLQEHFREQVSLSALAARSYLSRSRLSHLFTQQTGQSVTAYLAALRIHHAKELLRQEGMSIAEVSEDVGFRDAGHFTKVFRRLEGLSPSMYRQKKHKPPRE
ncbi:MAG: helix-turn-helix domain-containing protein [Candidatus Binatia bacterium]